MSLRWSRIDSFAGNSTSPSLTELRPCPVCSSERCRTTVQFDQFQFFSDSRDVPKRVNIREVQCLDCFALYLNPCYSKTGFAVLFAEAGRSYGATEGRPQEQIDWLTSRGLLKPGKRMLDAGCYDGSFLAKMPDSVRRVGVDIDEPALERGRRQFGKHGIEFIHGDFENFRCDDALDAITMFHVLEHLPRPVAVLRNLRSMAHAGTRLIVEVPILENGTTSDINGFFSVQHMTHFSRTSLQNCLASAGWEVEESLEQKDYNGFRTVSMPIEPDAELRHDGNATGLLHRYLSNWHSAIGNVERRLCALSDCERCILWGGGLHTEFMYHVTSFFQSPPGREYAIVDSDPMKHGRSWRGITIYQPDVLVQLDWSRERLLISSYSSQPGIFAAATKLGVPPERIVTLYNEIRIY